MEVMLCVRCCVASIFVLDLCTRSTGTWKPLAEDSNVFKVWKMLKKGKVERIETVNSDGHKLPEGSCVLSVGSARWPTHPSDSHGGYLYYRKDADTFYKEIIAPLVSSTELDKGHRMIVCGSPGIGKSYFLNAIIYNISQAVLKGEYPFVVNVFLHSVAHDECFWLQFGKDVVVEPPRTALNLASRDLELVTAHAKSVYLVDSGRGTKSMEPLSSDGWRHDEIHAPVVVGRRLFGAALAMSE